MPAYRSLGHMQFISGTHKAPVARGGLENAKGI
jgi:hypothetical protein